MNAAFYGKITGFFVFFLVLCGISPVAEELNCESNNFQLETSVWMIANLFPDSADFYQLSLGYQLDEKNVLFLNGLTWKYSAPLGISFGPDFESPDEEYPGYVRAFGLGIGYQRFFWKGLYSTVYVTPFAQNFYSNNDKLIDSGFQLFLQLQTGYQINFFKGRLYIKPALSFNYWPVNTNFPESFKQKEKNWPAYFLFEPHLNIGFTF